MISAHAQLQRLGYNLESPCHSVQMVRDKWEAAGAKGLAVAIGIIKEIASVDKGNEYTDAHFALHVAQHVVETAVKNEQFDPDATVVAGEDRAKKIRKDIAWAFVKAEPTNSNDKYEQVAVVEGLDVKVASKADGSIKKGGKGQLAEALWKKYMLECEGNPLPNVEFVKILMRDAQLTRSGSATYSYNLKKKFGVKQPAAS